MAIKNSFGRRRRRWHSPELESCSAASEHDIPRDREKELFAYECETSKLWLELLTSVTLFSVLINEVIIFSTNRSPPSVASSSPQISTHTHTERCGEQATTKVSLKNVLKLFFCFDHFTDTWSSRRPRIFSSNLNQSIFPQANAPFDWRVLSFFSSRKINLSCISAGQRSMVIWQIFSRRRRRSRMERKHQRYSDRRHFLLNRE